ncbi:RNA binding protein Mlo3 [Schizosaccharomyces japonicus yFS275]|uniref:RNA binding protein Mlo3 n=1 Tax=Schizosaccharomyces japonicus (strain yFS275 / FY16936) TaxID=402676 RepID=B6JYQ2_SCHJY|nr:RNA binding protein Mlo3 [Schizosaccharomyces japonicus yFS275]EEB06670.1 RNA binding protein Mlo3 [Schizosaccharomyces japonicus yFS275]
MELDQSLDAIIASKPKGGIRKRRPRQNKPKTPAGKQQTTNAVAAIKTVISEESKIIVSNLPTDVTEAQIKDLFVQSIGPCKRVSLAYGPNGRSKGIATVIFSRPGDASRAFEQYDGRMVDGTRKLRVEIILNPGKQLNSLAARVAPLAKTTKADSKKKQARKPANNNRRRRAQRPKKSAEELDKEMDDYFTGGEAAASTNTENKE